MPHRDDSRSGTPTPILRWGLLGMLLLFVLCGQHATAQLVELTGTDLQPRRVTLLSMDGQALSYIDPHGAEQTVALDRVLRLRLLMSKPTINVAAGAAWLVDGQVLLGNWAGTDDEETIRWGLVGGQSVGLSLDDVLVVSPGSADRPRVQTDGDDVLGLTSGEALRGFVETVGDTSVAFVIGDSDDAVPIPLERVAWLAIANDPEPADTYDAGGAWVALTDGGRLRVQAVSVERDPATGTAMLRGTLILGEDDSTFRVAMDRVMSIQPTGGTHRLVPLASLDQSVVSGGEVFGLAMLPEQDDQGGLRVHAPLTLAVELPEGATRLSMIAALDLGEEVPRERARLAGLELVIRQGGEELLRELIDMDRPEVAVNLAVADGALEIELDPGVNGPVLDRVVLRSAEVLVGGR